MTPRDYGLDMARPHPDSLCLVLCWQCLVLLLAVGLQIDGHACQAPVSFPTGARAVRVTCQTLAAGSLHLQV